MDYKPIYIYIYIYDVYGKYIAHNFKAIIQLMGFNKPQMSVFHIVKTLVLVRKHLGIYFFKSQLLHKRVNTYNIYHRFIVRFSMKF